MKTFSFIGALEISTDEVRFAVSRYSFTTNSMMFVHKSRLEGTWIENDKLIKRDIITNFVDTSIKEFESKFRTTLDEISLVIPDFAIRSIRTSQNESLTSPKLFETADKNHLKNKLENRLTNDYEKVISIQSYKYLVNGKPYDSKTKVSGLLFEGIFFVSLAPRELVNDHASIIEACGKKVGKIKSTSMSQSHILIDNNNTPTNIIVNWANNKIIISCYINNILVDVKEWSCGLNKIIADITNRFGGVKDKFIRNYMFKILNLNKFSELDDEIILRREFEGHKIECSAKTLKQYILLKLNFYIREIDAIIKTILHNKPDFRIHHIGKIAKFANYDQILKANSVYKNNIQISKFDVFGAPENWIQVLVGMICYKVKCDVNARNREIERQKMLARSMQQNVPVMNGNQFVPRQPMPQQGYAPNYQNVQMIQKGYIK
jgi:hypothetical protein